MSIEAELLKARIERLRIPQKRLIELTGLDKVTIYRTLNSHTEPMASTLRKLESAVAAEEADTAKYLAQSGVVIPGDAA